MPINFNTDLRATMSRPNPSEIPAKISSLGISEMPSSIESFINQSEGGFCSWVANLFEQICRFLCCSSASDSEVTTLFPLENRIAEGKKILDNHFQSDVILNANSPRSAIVVIMKYNGNYRVSVNTARVQRNEGRDWNKVLLQTLLTSESRISDGKLEIETMHFEKRNDNNFNLSYIDSSIKFANLGRMNGGCTHPSIHRDTVWRELERAVPSEDERRRVSEFLNQL